MDHPRSTSRSRRSYPNLHNLSLAPLSAKYLPDASEPLSPEEQTRTPRTSYIAQKSAPTTPGILSLSQSRSNSQQRSNKAYAYDSYFINTKPEARDVGDIPKAKSTSVLNPTVSFENETQRVEGRKERHHTRKSTAPLPLRSPLIKHHTREANDEWFHRAGLAIAGETRDIKGQGWLVRRESSTSLVQESNEYEQHVSHKDRHMALLSGEHIGDSDFPVFFSPRMSRAGSRITSHVGSRVTSARQSRRGSRVGSRVDFMSIGSNPKSGRQSLELDEFDERFIEPDFIEADEESDGDEEEVARLARERGSGLGGLMDRLIGWTLFSVDEDESDEEDTEEDRTLQLKHITGEELKLRREVEAKRRKLEREAIVAASALKRQQGDMDYTDNESRPSISDALRPSANEEAIGGWQDAAWLLSVASKALF
ncbi:hypothetical protein EJ02DRAFT_455657 [Clathrospora elynae]|uniref:Uncharacterized protein n=1 Tax=Clathrospora elynae TaxID=706981 RepID=A0A6A5SUU7_9PLEO|nr:hypothetical protein EJ02DRAFT_455657 [Clathrospora elynae]